MRVGGSSMGRPRGEVRQALANAAHVVGPDGATWRALAQRACVGFEVARATVENMVAAGELIAVGQAREPGVSRPMNRYVPAQREAAAAREVDAALRSWATFV